MAKKGAAADAVDFSEGDSIMVDLNAVEDVSFEALPKGIYPCVIAECDFSYSQASGNPMWTLVMEVTDGDYAGRKLFSHLVFAGAGLPITKRQLSRIAPELFDSAFDPEDDDVIQGMLGKNVMAKTQPRKYEGVMRDNVRDLFGPSEDSSFGT